MSIFTRIKNFFIDNKKDESWKINDYDVLVDGLRKCQLCFKSIPNGPMLEVLGRSGIHLVSEDHVFTREETIPSFQYFKEMLNKDGRTKIENVIADAYKITSPFSCSISEEDYNKAAYSKIPSKDVLYSIDRKPGAIRRANLPKEDTKNVYEAK